MSTTPVARVAVLAVIGTTLVLLTAGCFATSGRESEAGRVAQRFSRALADGDMAAACALLAAPTRDELEKSAKEPCADALSEEDIPTFGRITQTDVYGDRARVVGGADTVFLVDQRGWKVLAAGCERREHRPYDCELEGG